MGATSGFDTPACTCCGTAAGRWSRGSPPESLQTKRSTLAEADESGLLLHSYPVARLDHPDRAIPWPAAVHDVERLRRLGGLDAVFRTEADHEKQCRAAAARLVLSGSRSQGVLRFQSARC